MHFNDDSEGGDDGHEKMTVRRKVKMLSDEDEEMKDSEPSQENIYNEARDYPDEDDDNIPSPGILRGAILEVGKTVHDNFEFLNGHL